MCFFERAAPSGESLRGEGLVRLIGAVVCLLAVCRGSNCTLTRAMDRRNLRCSTIGSCHFLPYFGNCHFLRLYSAAGRGIAAVSSAIEESDLYLYLLYKPSTNQVERLHRTINTIIGKTVSEHQRDWDTRLPFANRYSRNAACRASKHESTDSPNMLTTGRDGPNAR